MMINVNSHPNYCHHADHGARANEYVQIMLKQHYGCLQFHSLSIFMLWLFRITLAASPGKSRNNISASHGAVSVVG
jgi:hypothetical protein